MKTKPTRHLRVDIAQYVRMGMLRSTGQSHRARFAPVLIYRLYSHATLSASYPHVLLPCHPHSFPVLDSLFFRGFDSASRISTNCELQAACDTHNPDL